MMRSMTTFLHGLNGILLILSLLLLGLIFLVPFLVIDRNFIMS